MDLINRLIVVTLLVAGLSPLHAATIPVVCPSGSLQTAINNAQPGDVIQVSGACNENILIRNEKQRITIDGGVAEQPPGGTTYHGNPSNYTTLLAGLVAGDTLQLAAGNYPGLPVYNLAGSGALPITITGPASGAPAIIAGSAGTNTVRIQNSQHVTIRNLEVNPGNLGGDGVNVQTLSHHITLDNLYIHGCSDDLQTVGISTNRAPTWNMIIRNTTVTDCGTGIYLGDSDGNEQFLAGIIENNLIYHTIGYNMQIKHQNALPTGIPGLPLTTTKTIIRNNVFSKATAPSSASALPRPNLLLGHAPATGNGVDNYYEVYGNFFYQNPNGEALIQATGNLAIYNNVMFNSVQPGGTTPAVSIQTQYQPPKKVRIFNNTVVANLAGISLSGGDVAYTQNIIGNAVFSASPISGGTQASNITGAYATASNYLENPFAALGAASFYPKVGALTGPPIDTTLYAGLYTDWLNDFNALPRTNQTFRGAYFGEGTNPGWAVNIAEKEQDSGTATISAASDTSPAVNIRGKGILLQNLTITGGSHGVWINRGSNAVLHNNVIQNSSGNGVVVDELAFAVLTNNTIQNNPGAGVVVSEASTARIGFNADSESSASANTIQNNIADGIILSNGSSARIIGNNIISNGGNGILVTRDSHADIASNAVSGNDGDGIEISENSNVQLGEDAGTSIYESPNTTTSANTGFGIKCSEGGVADGQAGTLTGSAGAKNFAQAGCIDSLLP